MSVLRKKIIHLHRCRGITRKKIRHMLALNPSLSNLYQSTASELAFQYRIAMKHAQLLHFDLHNQHIHASLKHDIQTYPTLTIVDEIYPHLLKVITDPPVVLYAMGDISLLFHQPALSVIGTRKPSSKAFQKMDFLLQPLIESDYLFVSGMAMGIDSYAHQLALKFSGKTIAVLGSGFHYVYPRQNNALFRQIARNGLLLSEYPPDTRPERYHFPERNRIISGLSFGTLVIEARERSGTLITVDQALDQGREVYAVPDSPLIPQTAGCHQMIQDGAKLVINAKDILEDWQSMNHTRFRVNLKQLD